MTNRVVATSLQVLNELKNHIKVDYDAVQTTVLPTRLVDGFAQGVAGAGYTAKRGVCALSIKGLTQDQYEEVESALHALAPMVQLEMTSFDQNTQLMDMKTKSNCLGHDVQALAKFLADNPILKVNFPGSSQFTSPQLQ